MDTNSKQFSLLLPVLLISILVAWLTFWPPNESASVEKIPVSNTKDSGEVTMSDGTKVLVAIADTDIERQAGLSGLVSIKMNTGMLFVFDKPGKYSFWMKDMNFPIDIIWISGDRMIVHIEKNVTPDTFPQLFGSSKNALYVLEVPAGFADAHDVGMADMVNF